MLDIVLFALSSLPSDLPISPSINLAESNSKCIRQHGSTSVVPMGIQPKIILMAMSNTNGFTPKHLLPQMYGTTVLDEDVELDDKELELIAGNSKEATSKCSDVFVDGTKIIDFNNFPYSSDQRVQIDYIKKEFGNKGVHISDTAAGILSNHLRHIAPLVTKGERKGFRLDLETGQFSYNE